MLKTLLDNIWIMYEEIDITETPEVINELELQTVPQFYVNWICIWWYTEVKDLFDKWELFNKMEECLK